jgi:hypothetical protein
MLAKPDRKAIRIASIGKEVLPCFALWGKWRKTARPEAHEPKFAEK